MPYTITEPHPTVPQNSYTHSGRGGLGNFFRAPATTSPSGIPTPATTTIRNTSSSSSSSSSAPRFYSGRGGAGNAHAAAVRPVLSFDEEYARAEVRDKKAAAAVSHVGRGGAGNIFSFPSQKEDVEGDDGESLGRRASASSQDSGRSTSSAASSLAGFWGRVRSAGGR